MTPAKKTITIAANTSWFIYNFHLSLVKMLQEDGYRIVLISPHDDYVERLEASGITHYDIEINSKGTNPIEDMLLVGKFYRCYQRSNADLILNYTIKPNIYGTIAAKMLGIPVISSITGMGTVFLNDKLSSKIGRMLYRLTMRIPKKVFFLNHYDRDHFVEYKLVKKQKTAVIPGSGIDPEIFKPMPSASGKAHSFCVLFIGRLLKDKGIVEFVEAARIIQRTKPDVEFCILGAFYPGNPSAISPEEMGEWEKEACIRYLGTNDDVPLVIAESDCIALPSYREGISRVLLEAASMGKPIIASDVPGCREVIEDGVNGYLSEVKNAESLARQVEKVVDLSYGARQKMGQHGRQKIINEFDDKIVMKRYHDAITSVLNAD